MRKTGCFVTTAIIGLIVGFIFLIRSCLSNYDEYAIEGSAQVFMQPSATVIVYIKDHYDVSYFSQEGGVTNISGTRHYYLETRDALSLTLSKSTRLDGKDAEVPKILGNTGRLLWIYDKQLKAFDPFTLTMVCNEDKLVQQNPALRNILPVETRYYTYNYSQNRLEVFTKTATRFSIGEDFKAIPLEEETEKEPADIAQLKAKIKQYEALQSSQYNNPNYYHRRDSIWQMEKLVRKLQDKYNDEKEFRERLNEMQNGQFSTSDNLIINAAVKDSTVYALIPRKDMDTTNTYFYFRQYFSEEEQHFLCKASIEEISKSQGLHSSAKVGKWKSLSPGQYFLKGNFLLNKQSLEPITMHNPESWLVISVKEIAQNSPLLLQRVEPNGKIRWTKELPIYSFTDLLYIPDKAIVFCSKPASNDDDQRDKLLSVDVQTGDYLITGLNKP
ncbi:MAG TPA: PA2928 family protein [Bacteroidales bacterium]|nr:PA2928 family protein [Bacteroidales bacterium]